MFRKYIVSTALCLVLAGCTTAPGPTEDLPESVPSYSQTDLETYRTSLEGLVSEIDTIENFTRYRDFRAEWYVDVRTAVVPFIVQVDGFAPILRVRYQYVGLNWIFWQTLVVAADEERKTANFSPSDIKRDSTANKVWEFHSTEVGAVEKEILEALASADSSTVRFKGSNGSADLVLSDENKDVIRKTLDAYKWLTWKYEQGT